MSASAKKICSTLAAVALCPKAALPISWRAPRAAAEEAGAQVKPVLTEKLPNVPGKSLTGVVVTYPPGGKSGKHHHAGSVFVYVLSGAIRSETPASGPAKVYTAGETFFEPPGSEHLFSENASATGPASLLAVFIADDGTQLTVFDSKP